jgi:hypothetical protein
LRGSVTQYFDFEVAWGLAMNDTDRTDKGDSDLYFVVRGQF